MFDFSYSNILEANLINFVIMLLIFALLGWKLKIGEKIEASRKKIEQFVEDSSKKVIESEKKLNTTKDSLKNLPLELEEIEKNAQNALKNLEKQVETETDKIVASLNLNKDKELEREVNKVEKDLRNNLSISSIEKAKETLKNMMRENPDLHHELINDIIENLDRL